MEFLKDRHVINAQNHSLADYPSGLNLIFDYLLGNDLISCLLVNKQFYQQISTSEKLMSKIVLKIPKGKFSRANRLLRQTDRKYKNICIQGQLEYQIDLLNPYFKWSSIEFKNVTFGPQLWIFLRQFTETIVELIFVNNPLQLLTNDNFPVFKHLKVLKINNKDATSILMLNEFKSNFCTIKHLTTSQVGMETGFVFIHDLNNMKLETLHIIRPKLGKYNIKDAIFTQKKCLKELTIETINTKSIEYIWDQMEVLKKVTLGAKVTAFKKSMSLRKNNSIEEIVVHNTKVPFEIYEKLVISTPNLTLLRVSNKNHLGRGKLNINYYKGSELRAKFQEKEDYEIIDMFHELKINIE